MLWKYVTMIANLNALYKFVMGFCSHMYVHNCNCRNIGGTFNLVIQHELTELKTANILVHAHNVIVT